MSNYEELRKAAEKAGKKLQRESLEFLNRTSDILNKIKEEKDTEAAKKIADDLKNKGWDINTQMGQFNSMMDRIKNMSFGNNR